MIHISRQLIGLAGGLLVTAAPALAAQLTLEWTDNSGGTATTRVERRLGTETTYSVLADVEPPANSYVDGSVSQLTTYCYRVMAYDALGSTAYSDEACAKTNGGIAVSVRKAGSGAGTLTSEPPGIDCGATCSATIVGTSVTLRATPVPGSEFQGWEGSCTGVGSCTVVGNGAVSVTANFVQPRIPSFPLTVAQSGHGTVTSTPAGIRCGRDCSASYRSGTAVMLIAIPARNATFTGWKGGGCEGRGVICLTTIRSATSVSASFGTRKAAGR